MNLTFFSLSAGSRGDYAEWFLRADEAEQIQPGDIVGVDDQKRISLTTAGAAFVGVVSTAPAFVGNPTSHSVH